MMLSEIMHRIDDIKQCANDDEAAHSKEDRLRHDVLAAIAYGTLQGEDVKIAADLALSTTDIEFNRWCG